MPLKQDKIQEARDEAARAIGNAKSALWIAEDNAKKVEVRIQIEENPPEWKNTLKARVRPSPNSGVCAAGFTTGWQEQIRQWAELVEYPYYIINGHVFTTKFNGYDTGLTEEDLK